MDENTKVEDTVDLDVDKKIRDYCSEMSASFLRTEAERDFRKDATERLFELIKVPKQDLNFLARTYHKGDFDQKTQRMSDQRDLYVRIFGEPVGNSDSHPNFDIDDDSDED